MPLFRTFGLAIFLFAFASSNAFLVTSPSKVFLASKRCVPVSTSTVIHAGGTTLASDEETIVAAFTPGLQLLLDSCDLPQSLAKNLADELLALSDKDIEEGLTPGKFPALARVDARLKEQEANATEVTTLVGISACTQGAIKVTLDVVAILFSMLSLGAEANVVEPYIADYLVNNGAILSEIESTIPEIAEAGSLQDKAIAVAKLAKVLYNSGSLTEAIKKAVSDMPWYKKAYTLAAALATVALWFATGEAAFVAQLVIVLATSASLFVDARAADTACSGN